MGFLFIPWIHGYSIVRQPTEGTDSMKSLSQKAASCFGLITALALLFACSTPGNQTLVRALRGKVASANGSPFPRCIGGTATARLTTGTFGPASAPALGIAMADFTGDTHPDLATVELDRFDSAIAHYWIEIQLTEGGRQFLRVTAPFGGLLIIPRDVTGDGNLDLVVRSAQSNDLMAVFLNDGSGRFSRADIAGFSKILRERPSQFGFTAPRTYRDPTLACLESHTAGCPSGSLRHLRERKGSLLSSNYIAAFQSFLSFGATRAPPSRA
jgi:hypothetical protein